MKDNKTIQRKTDWLEAKGFITKKDNNGNVMYAVTKTGVEYLNSKKE